MNFEEWLEEYREDKNRSDVDWYPNNVQVFEAGQQRKQEEVNKLQGEIDALKVKIDDLVKWAEFHIEDYNLSESESEHDRGWFNAACQVFKTLKENNNDT